MVRAMHVCAMCMPSYTKFVLLSFQMRFLAEKLLAECEALESRQKAHKLPTVLMYIYILNL